MGRPRASPTFETYVFAIHNVEISYRLSVDHTRLREEPYDEMLHLLLRVSCVFPTDRQGVSGEFALLGDRTRFASNVDASERHPTLVGLLTVQKQTAEFLCAVPFEVLWPLHSLFASDGLRYAVLHGTTLFRGKSQVRSLAFERDFDPAQL